MATFKDLFGKQLDLAAAETTSGSYDPIPKGRYTIVADKIDDNRRTQSGKMAIGFMWRVVGPSHARRLIFQDFYVAGVSDKCASISFSQIASISKCAFGKAVDSTDELVGATVDADVEIEAQPGYKPRNVIKRFYPATKTDPKPAAAPAAQPVPPPPKEEEQMPWEF